jgi:hypothetical protein
MALVTRPSRSDVAACCVAADKAARRSPSFPNSKLICRI